MQAGSTERVLHHAGGPGEELEGMRLQPEGQVAQNFRTKTVSQSHILEPDHAPTPIVSGSAQDPQRGFAPPAAIRHAIFGPLDFYRIRPPQPPGEKRSSAITLF